MSFFCTDKINNGNGVNILVTGSTGFIGRHVVRLLRRHRIKHCTLSRHRVSGSGAYRGDISDPAFVRGVFAKERPTHCIHLAATGLRKKNANAAEIMRVNVGGTKNVLEAIRDLHPKTIGLLVGSSAEYGLRARTARIPESGRLRPENAYGRSKVECFRLFQRFKKCSGMHLLYCRPFNVIGPGAHEAHFLSRLIRAELAGRLDPAFQRRNQRDYIDVRDVASAILALCKRGKAAECYNICTGQGVRGAHLLATVRVALGKTTSASPEHHASAIQGQARHQVGNNQKISRSLHWHPVYPFEQSVLDQVRALRGPLSAMIDDR